MKQSKEDISMGRFISLVLRHNPGAAGITLDENGWAKVEDLIQGINQTGRSIDLEILERIVRENNKKRYIFNEDHTKIRANQGHSIDVDVQLQQKNPPDVLYHGTAERFKNSILKEGIKKQNRQHVHLSPDQKTAVQVGKRHGKPVILSVNAEKMKQDGFTFYQSENGVWLTDHVPPCYLSITA